MRSSAELLSPLQHPDAGTLARKELPLGEGGQGRHTGGLCRAPSNRWVN